MGEVMKKIMREEIIEISDTEFKAEFWYTLDGINVIKKSKITVTKGEAKEHLDNFKANYNSIELHESSDIYDKSLKKQKYENLNDSLHNYANKTKVDVIHELASLQTRLEQTQIELEKTKERVNIIFWLLIGIPLLTAILRLLLNIVGPLFSLL